MKKYCAHCEITFSKKSSHSVKAWASVRYCSKACYSSAQRAAKTAPTVRFSGTPWNKGQKLGTSPRNTRVTRSCAHCRADFTAQAYRAATAIYCSRECHYAASAPRVNTCTECATTFTKKQNPQAEYRFCSQRCSGQFNNRHLRKDKIEANCLECGDLMQLFPYEAENGRRFCSKSCSDRNKDEGKTTEAQRIRASSAYAAWRTQVFERDDFTCQICSQRGGKLHADHIKRFSDYPELRLDVSNGRTLCAPCHLATPTFGNRKVVAVAQEA
jgi:5-methylcytosine-specific restriction endonuclease McrA